MIRTRISFAIIALVFAAAPALAAPPAKSTKYPFALPPDKAIAAVEKLEKISGKTFAVTDAERALFDDARDGKLDKHSFAEACLIASGVTDAAKRKEYVAKLDAIEAEAGKAIEGAKTPAEKAERLLKFLHAGPMKGGYESNQTDLHTLLDTGKFNCVSSAVLYNVIGRRLGLDLAAVEVPEHVFSVLHDGDRHTDVETTNSEGFNPKGVKTPKGKSPADRYAGKRREVGEVGLAAVIAYNHGVGLGDEKQHHEAVLANFRALSLDPTNPQAAHNTVAAYVKWGCDLLEDKKYEDALAVVAAGLEVAPKDAALTNNHKVVWHEYAENRMEAGKDTEALAVLRRAAKAIPSGDFEALQADLYIRPGQKLVEDGKWDDAVTLYTAAIEKVDAKAKPKLKGARVGVFLDRANATADKGEYEAALDILKQGAAIEPKDGNIRNNTLAVYDTWANTYMKKGDWAGAIEVYEKALAHLPGDSHLKQNLAYCKQEQAKK